MGWNIVHPDGSLEHGEVRDDGTVVGTIHPDAEAALEDTQGPTRAGR